MRFVAIVFTALLALAANALPPGTDDEIDARLAPFGTLNRAAIEEVAVAAAPAAPPAEDRVLLPVRPPGAVPAEVAVAGGLLDGAPVVEIRLVLLKAIVLAVED